MTAERMTDLDGLEYTVDEAFAFPTRVDASGVRFMLETMPLSCAQKDGVTLHPRFRLLSHGESDAALLARKATDIVTNSGIIISQVSVKSTDVSKPTNEDRAFVHPFVHGTLFGVFDGHNGDEHVSKAVKELPDLVAQALTAALDATAGHALDEVTRAIHAAFSQAFLAFDASLLKGMDDAIEDILSSGKYKECTEQVLMYEMWQEWKSGANRPALAVQGSTAVMGYIPNVRDHIWTAAVGDSESWHGRSDGNTWKSTPLNEVHSTSNDLEVARLKAEHPGEDVIQYRRVLGNLPMTRALGNHLLKAPMERVLQYYRFARPVVHLDVLEWKGKFNTAPYLSAQPTFKDMDLVPGDVVVMASDGLSTAPQVRGWSAEDKAELFVSLPGGRRHLHSLPLWEEKLGHRLLSCSEQDGNVADWLLQNVLYGADDVKRAREAAIEVPPGSERWQDDTTIVVACI